MEENNYDDLSERMLKELCDSLKDLTVAAEQTQECCRLFARSIVLEYSKQLVAFYEKSLSSNILVRWYYRRRFRKLSGGVPEFIDILKPLLKDE